MAFSRNRLIAAFILLALIPVGIFSKFYQGPFYNWVHFYSGDIISVSFVFFLLKFFSPRIPNIFCGSLTFLIAVCIEFSQLLKFPVLLELRKQFLVSIIIGQQFDMQDFAYYLLGVFLSMALSAFVFSKNPASV